jgi:hypothetical protein
MVVAVVVGANVVLVVRGTGEVGRTLALLAGPEEQLVATNVRTISEATLARRSHGPFIWSGDFRYQFRPW